MDVKKGTALFMEPLTIPVTLYYDGKHKKYQEKKVRSLSSDYESSKYPHSAHLLSCYTPIEAAKSQEPLSLTSQLILTTIKLVKQQIRSSDLTSIQISGK